ncbi:hypothetical protein BH10PSE19_BH10PSE19_06140 [soil metagenome]
MQHNPIATEIHQRIHDALNPHMLEILDESAHHVGHAGAAQGGGHYAVIIATDAFQGKSLVQCHQMIYSALGNMMEHEIHALRINVKK